MVSASVADYNAAVERFKRAAASARADDAKATEDAEQENNTFTMTSANEPSMSLAMTVDESFRVDEETYGVRLSIENVGSHIYDGDVSDQTGTVTLYDSDGTTHNATNIEGMAFDGDGNPLPGVLERVHIWPGERASGCVYFDIDASSAPSSFRYAPTGMGKYAEWRVE